VSFREHLLKQEDVYIFIDIPSEDIFLIQCLGMAGFKMAETRLHFFKDNVLKYNGERYQVRKATIQDLTEIVEVAKKSRNDYDRVHADFGFSTVVADEYLGVYAGSAVKGYCDAVLVPAEAGLPTDAFLALSEIKEEDAILTSRLFRIVLTAVGPANKGWHIKLVSETIHYAKELGASHVLMTTQSTNRAVFRTSEKLGFKLGGTTHIFSYSK
jgi:dTDP-4-amino-4,6-dideoxy-D-galactose acyltransferase